MQGDKTLRTSEHVCAVVEDALCAVAVVHVDVDDRYSVPCANLGEGREVGTVGGGRTPNKVTYVKAPQCA